MPIKFFIFVGINICDTVAKARGTYLIYNIITIFNSVLIVLLVYHWYTKNCFVGNKGRL